MLKNFRNRIDFEQILKKHFEIPLHKKSRGLGRIFRVLLFRE